MYGSEENKFFKNTQVFFNTILFFCMVLLIIAGIENFSLN
jgi:hypothetical protein